EMDFDAEHNIYGCASFDPELHIFSSTNLDKVKLVHLKTNYYSKTTYAHCIKVLPTEIIVLFSNSEYPLQSFTRDGELIRTILSDRQVTGSAYFCIDLYNNFIISDISAHQVKIFRQSGELIVAIG
ncbi:hypothetical protein, partial [Salmonella sp. s51228]|uniref:hypothetical protein n=1 Tax=Salmonella sp. s51228 TaxID=3159652 RepID=UPI0039805DF8